MVLYIAMGHAFSGMYSLVANYIFFGGRTASLAAISFIAGLLNFGLSYWLLLRNGAIGAAQAFMISQAVIFLGAWLAAQRAHPMPWLAALKAR
jgi:O-antigen/teichoic acid export membrane protein